MILSYDMILENLPRTDRQTENSKPEATLIPVDRRGERANYRANRSGLIMQKKIRKFAQNRQTDTHTDREFNYRGHSYPLWIVGGSGPIFSHEFQSEFQKYNIISSIYSFTSHQRHPTLVITQCGNFSNNFPTLCEGSYLILPNQF